MAGEDRIEAHALEFERALEKEPYRFDFYQTVRRLECKDPGKPRIGHSPRPVDDPVRLAQEPSLAFAPSALASYRPRRDGHPARLSVSFMGLLGPNGPLPLHLTEFARDRLRNHLDPTFSRFLDVFHHRILSMFYRAWASAQPAVSFDRPESDRFALYVGSLFGMGLPSQRDRDVVPDLTKLFYAGQFVCPTRHAEGLKAILAGFFRLPVEVEQFVGEWIPLPRGNLCRLGQSRETSTLGRSLIVGSRVWECQHKFRVLFGPMSLVDYEDLLPGGASLDRLTAMIQNFLGGELAWDVELILKKEEVPDLKLDGEGKLGWTTWITTRPMEKDPDDLLLDPEERVHV